MFSDVQAIVKQVFHQDIINSHFYVWISARVKQRKTYFSMLLMRKRGLHSVSLRMLFIPDFSWSAGTLLVRVMSDDVTKIDCEITNLVKIFRKKKMKDPSILKFGILPPISDEILPLLCSDKPIQILFKLAWFLTLRTKSFLKGFVWSH